MKTLAVICIMPLSISCSTLGSNASNALGPCQSYQRTLGPSHQCTVSEGGALDEIEIRRELTSRVVSEGRPLPHKEFGRTVLIFSGDGRYEARKLHFTQYFAHIDGQKTFLVYAEDSSGNYRHESDGTITLSEPDDSTCPDREKGSDETLKAHIQFEPKEEPYSAISRRSTRVAFDNDGWIKDFHGESYWRGEAVERKDVQWPPYPKDKETPRIYHFTGFKARIHYGCLDQGFQAFRGNDQVYLVERFRYDAGVNPYELVPGTRLRRDP